MAIVVAASAAAGGRTPTTLVTTTPTGGSIVTGTIAWRVATQGAAPKTVYFSVDGVLRFRDRTSPFTASLDTTTLSNGRHTLVASIASGRRSSVGGSESAVAVTVLNSSQTEALPDPSPTPPRSCVRPYGAGSPWNTPVGAAPVVVAGTLTGILDDDTLSSEPLQYAYPVYEVDASTPATSIYVRGTYSNVVDTGTRISKGYGGTNVAIRLPTTAKPSAGSDAHLVVVDPATGDEWGFWETSKDASGHWAATNGYHYNTHWSGVPPAGFGSRGAGVTYLAGLIRPCEIAQAHIDHALAFAYDYPRNTYVYPATKSDGKSTDPLDLPEGSRLQLDPTITDTTIRSWGCTGPCLTIAHAMQTYGMYVIDNSGRDKIYTEDDLTAHWNSTLTRNTISPIPEHHLRHITTPAP